MSGHSLVPIDHPYIDDHNVAERFVSGELPLAERASFERHYVDCAECMDRVALAQLFHVDAQKRTPEAPLGIFHFLATFNPRHQIMIFAASTLALLLIPIAGMNWLDGRAAVPAPEAEPVIWLPQSGSVDARIPASANWISISAMLRDQQGTYRLSIVDVSDRPIVTGPDQMITRGTALGLRLPSFPTGVIFAVVEKKAENGAYSMVSRHPLSIDWR